MPIQIPPVRLYIWRYTSVGLYFCGIIFPWGYISATLRLSESGIRGGGEREREREREREGGGGGGEREREERELRER